MRYLLAIIATTAFMANCADPQADPRSCSVKATVVDLRSLDGCDFAFELEDGTRLLPERRTYVQAPSKESDPVYHYQFTNGTRVKIGFEESPAFGACMAGQIVFVTCITNVPDSNP
jgi:hypothetical protein